jgi:hypothetical protein
MACPYLERGEIAAFCSASVTLMVPSVFEEEAFCRTVEHRRCPVLCARETDEGRRGRSEDGPGAT